MKKLITTGGIVLLALLESEIISLTVLCVLTAIGLTKLLRAMGEGGVFD